MEDATTENVSQVANGVEEVVIWEDIRYATGYQISNSGLLKSKERVVVDTKGRRQPVKEKILVLRKNRGGYLYARISINCQMTTIFPHIETAKYFVPNPENKPEVNHNDGDKTNNSSGNLIWATRSENQQHAFNTGLQKPCCGDAHGVKLKENDVLNIVELGKTCYMGEIGRMLGKSRSTISYILTGKTWSRSTGIKYNKTA